MRAGAQGCRPCGDPPACAAPFLHARRGAGWGGFQRIRIRPGAMAKAKRTVTKIRTKVRSAASGDGVVVDGVDQAAFSPLHWMAAGLFLATGAEAAASRRLSSEVDGQRRSPWRVLGLAPLVVAPLAGVAHGLEAARPARRSSRFVKVLDGVAVGV